jgi:hypothetical protein
MTMNRRPLKLLVGLVAVMLTFALGCGDRPSNSNDPTKPEMGTEGDPETTNPTGD